MTPHDLRERIEQILQQPGSVSKAKFQEVAGTYAAVITDLNHRLSICNRWLAEGLRTEALHMASLEPDLLDAMGQLDLGDALSDWVELCSANGAPVPPRANWELASFVNEAWDVETRLIDQLRALRLAMLTHQSIEARLAALRRLLDVDRGNPAWETMTRQHERLRMQELEADLLEAADQMDLRRVSKLHREVNDARWIEPPSTDLLRVSATVRETVREKRVQKEYTKLADRLHKAMSAGDREKAQVWRNRWTEVTSASDCDPGPDAAAAAAAAFQWLDELEADQATAHAHELACRALTIGLDDQDPLEELEPLHFRIEQMDAGVPELLEHRYQEYVRSVGRQRRTRLVLRGGLAAAVLGLIATGAVFLAGWYSDRLDVDEFAQQYRSALADENIPVLSELGETGRERFPDAMDVTLVEEVAQARVLIEAWHAQRARFEELFDRLSVIPDKADLTQTEIDTLTRLAQTPEEIALKDKLVKLRNDAVAARNAGDRNTFDQALAKASSRFEDIDASEQSDSDEARLQAATALLDAIAEIRGARTPATPSASLARLDALQGRVRNLVDSLEERRSRSREAGNLEGRLASSFGSMTQLLSSLERLHGATSAEAPYRRDLQRVLDAEKTLIAIDAWAPIRSELPPRLGALDDGETDLNSIVERLGDLSPSPALPAETLVDLKDCLKSMSQMREDDNSPSVRLAFYLSPSQSWAHDRLMRVIQRDGILFALQGTLKRSDDRSLLRGYVNHANQILNGVGSDELLSNDDRPPGRQYELEPTGLAQWKDRVAKLGRMERPETTTQLWYLDLLAELMAIQPMEAHVQLGLAAKLASFHNELGWPQMPDLEEAADEHLMLPPETWPDPLADRAAARAILGRLTRDDIEAMRRAAKAHRDQLQADLPPAWTFAGHVWKTDDGKSVDIIRPNALARDQDVYAFTFRRGNYDWQRVGIWRANDWEMLDLSGIPLGMPLLASPPQGD